MEEICVEEGGERIVLPVERRKVKRLRVVVSRGGKVRAVAPFGYPIESIRVFLESKKKWLFRAYRRQKDARDLISAPFLTEDNRALLLGKKIPVRVYLSEQEGVLYADEEIAIRVRSGDVRRVDRVYLTWMVGYGREIFSRYVDKWMPIFASRGIERPPIFIKVWKSKWGSCHVGRKEITMNLHLIKAPEECVEYVVLHELTHLIHRGHGKPFHAFLTRYMPDWKVRKKRLHDGVFAD